MKICKVKPNCNTTQPDNNNYFKPQIYFKLICIYVYLLVPVVTLRWAHILLFKLYNFLLLNNTCHFNDTFEHQICFFNQSANG